MMQLNMFSRQTALHGFNYFISAETRSEGFMFLILVVFSVIMLTRDTVILVAKYQSEPTITELSVMHNKTITINKPTLCIGTSSFGYIVNLQSLTDEQINFTVNQIRTEYVNVTEISIQGRMACSDSDNLKECDKWWNKYNLTFQFVYMTLIGLLQRENSIADSYASGYRDVENLLTLSPQLISATELIRLYLVTGGFNMRNVFGFVGYMMCFRANIIYYRNITVTFKDFCQTAKLTWFGPSDVTYSDPTRESLLCYQFEQNFKFISPTDELTFSLDTKCAIYKSLNVWVDLSGRKYFSDAESATSAILIDGKNIRTTAEVTFDFHSYNSKRQPCDTRDRQLECQLDCRQKYLIESCKCFPISLITEATKPSNLPYCLELQSLNETKLTSYISAYTDLMFIGTEVPIESFPIQHAGCIEKYLQGNLSISGCTDTCQNPCNYRSFTIRSEVADTSLKSNTNRRGFRLSFTRFVYPSFVEEPSMTWEDFLSAFGGSMGLWLGASLIAFIHVPYFIMRSIVDTARKNKEPTKPPVTSVY